MSAARTERLLNLLTLLLNARRPVSLRQIRELDEFAAYRSADPRSGERAFERDKAALVELGVPVTWVAPDGDEEGDGADVGGYLIDRDAYYLPALDLSPAEVAQLSIAGAAAVALPHFPGKDAIVRALAKLGFDVDESAPTRSLAHVPTTAGDAARIGISLEVLHDAVARRLKVRFAYEGLAPPADGKRKRRTVDPWGLYYRHGAWYVIGWCHLRKAERTFHLGRMAEVELVDGAATRPQFEVPASFDLRAAAGLRPWEFPGGEQIEVVIRLAPRLVPAIGEIFGPHVAVARRGEETLVTLRVTHRAALVQAVLPYGAGAEVLSPADLRQEIGAIYATLAACHETSPGAAQLPQPGSP